jgi:hypothetical protein
MEGDAKKFYPGFSRAAGNRRGGAARAGITIPRQTTTACGMFYPG